MNPIEEYGTFAYDPAERQWFRSGRLWEAWYQRYPRIFDSDDLRLASNQAELGYHFFEWLAAIQVFRNTGYLSLVEKYQFDNHPQKKEVLKKLASTELHKAIQYCKTKKGVQCPDLLAYSVDCSDWQFYEVKGDEDRISKCQREQFQTLLEITKKPVRLIRFAKQANRL
jgi:hypothetical protein